MCTEHLKEWERLIAETHLLLITIAALRDENENILAATQMDSREIMRLREALRDMLHDADNPQHRANARAALDEDDES